jgi:hypothetical protein
MSNQLPLWSWGLAIFAVVLTTSVPGVLYASLDGRPRMVALTSFVGIEVIAVLCIGLYLRMRGQ